MLPPDLVETEAYGVVDAALAELDPIDVGLITLVDLERAPFSRAIVALDRYFRDALAAAKSHGNQGRA